MLRYWLCNVEPIRSQAGGLQVESEAPRPTPIRQATGKLSLSIQSSSAALMTHPTLVRSLKYLPASKFPSSNPHNHSQPLLGSPFTSSGWKYQLARRVLSGDGSAGGVLILGWWESALFFKSSLFERSEFGLLENAFSRFPAT